MNSRTDPDTLEATAWAEPRSDWRVFLRPRADGGVHLDLAVEGIACAGCIPRIERALADVPGLTAARVNFTRHRLGVDGEAGTLDPGAVLARLEALGYRARPFDPAIARDAEPEAAAQRQLLRALAVAGFAAMNVMLLSVSIWSGNVTDITPETRDLFHWISALIALPAAAYAGRPFFASAWRALKARRTNMDVPISLGVVLALGLSLWQTVEGAEHAYFDSALMLLFFLLLGRVLDRGMRRRTRAFAENLAALRSETTLKIASDGRQVDTPLSAVRPGDLIVTPAGCRVALDGIVESGHSELDQSLVTGETLPVLVRPGTAVHAGALNGSGALTVRVSRASGETLLDDVMRLLETAAQAKSRHMRLADRAARAYAPVVHAAAALTFVGWLAAGVGIAPALVIAISVLIITCPCALGLAIPAVQVVASGALFRAGVLLNSSDAIERLAEIDTVAFDKTGTLTQPTPHLVNAGDVVPEDLRLAADLARRSHHPLARAIAAALPQADTAEASIPLTEIVEEAGAGVRALHGGRTVRLGAPAFAGLDCVDLAKATAMRPGATVLALKPADGPAVPLVIEQRLRPGAAKTVTALKAHGFKLEILSGDRLEAVAPVAATLGVEIWRGGLKPAEKIARLKALANDGRRVLMVGDGLNDAPALAAAH